MFLPIHEAARPPAEYRDSWRLEFSGSCGQQLSSAKAIPKSSLRRQKQADLQLETSRATQ